MTGKPHNNTNPRKFKEKIELLRQKEAQLTANFLEVMRGIPTLTRSVVPHADLANKDLSPSYNIPSSPRISLDAFNHQYALDSNTGSTNRNLYNNSSGARGVGDPGSHGSASNKLSRLIADTQPLPPQTASQGRSLETPKSSGNWSRHHSTADSGDSGLISQISPLGGTQSSPSSSVSYQPNLAPISVSPHSPSASSLPPMSSTTGSTASNPPPPPQFFTSTELPPSVGAGNVQRQQFHPPLPPPPPQSASKTTGYGRTDSAVAGTNGIPGGMSLMDYRRTYSDSCIPSNFLEPNRRFQQCQQYPNNQLPRNHPPLPPPASSGLRQPQRRTLPPVDELALPRYQHMKSCNASGTNNTASGSYFNEGLSLSPRCRHQSYITVSDQYPQYQSWRKLQPDYHSMRNIPQRYAPINHIHHHNQTGGMMPTQQQPVMMESYEYQNNGTNSMDSTNSWDINGAGNGFSASECDLPSTMPMSRLRRSDVCNQLRSKQQTQPPSIQPPPQMSSSICYANSRTTTTSDPGGGGGGYYDSNCSGDSYVHHHPPLHQQQHLPPSSSTALCLGAGGTNGAVDNNNVVSSSHPPLTQDIGSLVNDAFPSPEQEGRRESFSIAVDLLSRLEKRPLDTSSCNSTASPPIVPMTPVWNSSVSPPPSKSAKFDPSSTAVTNPGPNFYVPIAEKDLQLLTEPSMINYVTDAATEDQLVREQYSPN
ncbi:hypothetical protein Aperf_G00000108393 [Anoplocephala perfoliata]